jgi:hypothetical protein
MDFPIPVLKVDQDTIRDWLVRATAELDLRARRPDQD